MSPSHTCPALLTRSDSARLHAVCTSFHHKVIAHLPPVPAPLPVPVPLPEGVAWWETRETLETIDASQNELTSLPAGIAGLDCLRELELTHNRPTGHIVWLTARNCTGIGVHQ